MKRKLDILAAEAPEPAARRLWKTGWQGLVAGICFAWTALAAAQTGAPAPAPSPMLSNIKQIWDVAGEAAKQPQRIKTEVVIYYFDADWNCAWGECLGKLTYLPIADSPMPLKAGQRVAIDGLVLPSNVRFLWDKTRVQVLEEGVLPQALEISDLSSQSADLAGHIVSMQGLIERLKMVDQMHVQINFLSGTAPVWANVLTATNDLPLPFKEGDYVRVQGVYVPKFNRDGSLAESVFWVAQRADVEVTGSLSKDPRFALPATPVEKISDGLPGNQMIRVEGIVRSHEPGKRVTLWDDTGQVSVQSDQLQPLQFGDRVEAIGFPYVLGVQQCLRNALYRVVEEATQTNPAAITVSPSEPIRLAARIQYLSTDAVSRHPAVKLRGVLMWSHHDTPFVYVQDASGGIRVVNPGWPDAQFAPGTIVTVRGNVAQGDYVPVVTNAVISRVGWRGFDQPQPVSLEQALTGVEDGRWVEMRGFVRKVTQVAGLTHLELSTSSGEFQAWTPTSPAVDSLPGTIVRIDGVCSASANGRRQLTGIQLWAPDPIFIKIDEQETADLFATGVRPLENLKRFNSQNELNQRVKTVGTVVLHQPGRYLYLQDGPDSVFALSRQADPLRPGDRVEVVGFPGNERGKFLLREAVFRRLAGGAEPAPVPLPAVDAVNVNLGGLLAKAEGVLLNTVQKDDDVRLLIRSGGATFEAGLESVDNVTAEKFHALPIGIRLALTGVYEVQNDEYGRPDSFLLQLRSWDDVRILAQPPWWTLSRLLALLVGVIVVFVISLIWGILNSRNNLLLRQAQAELQTVNRELESFSYSVSHDLRSPLRAIDGFSQVVLEDNAGQINAEGRNYLERIRAASQRMGHLIDDLLQLSRHTRSEMHRTQVDLSALAHAQADALLKEEPGRCVEFVIAPDLVADADASLLQVVLENLLGNAWKFTGKQAAPKIEFGCTTRDGAPAYFVRDNGAGFDTAYAHKLFGAFQRLHTTDDFPGTGIGLASVQRIIHRHGGRVWAEGEAGHGATFYFTLPTEPKKHER